jgi:hypothetical protein
MLRTASYSLLIRCSNLYFVTGSLHLSYLTLGGVPKAMVPRAHFWG